MVRRMTNLNALTSGLSQSAHFVGPLGTTFHEISMYAVTIRHKYTPRFGIPERQLVGTALIRVLHELWGHIPPLLKPHTRLGCCD